MNYATAILKAPSGRYIVVGAVPVACCHPDGRQIAYDTEAACRDAIAAAGVKRFQLADCSWFEVPAPVHYQTGRGTLCSLDNDASVREPTQDRASVTCVYCLGQMRRSA